LPLEPLATHLDSSTYELFESDKEKYDLYERAIRAALAIKPNAIVAVVGAGRGPLVERALACGARKIFVVEKNFAAYCFLRGKVAGWGEKVQLFKGDMRFIELPEKVDVIVSELLGGFGDNELSPECLLGCNRLLAPDAISVPSQYTSILVPLMSDWLWSVTRNSEKRESCCVSRLLRSTLLSAPQECMTFNHPGVCEMYRQVRLEFIVSSDGFLHGFGGWFDCTLFGEVKLTNQPFAVAASWAQCFFPIEKPIPVGKDAKIVLYFERKTNGESVWYEWFLLEPEVTKVLNLGGRHCAFGLFWD
jgi:protein arginine N-methyltransferase 5